MPAGRPEMKIYEKRRSVSCTITPVAHDALTDLGIDNWSHFIDLAIKERVAKLIRMSKRRQKSQ